MSQLVPVALDERASGLPHSDALLDPNILVTPGDSAAIVSAMFLTGATGFLGSQVLVELLRSTSSRVICLVRAGDKARAAERMAAALAATGCAWEDFEPRIVPLCGDLAEPDFGLTAAAFDELASSVSQIFHCGAEVSWIGSYERLRGSHVVGTLNAIRLACRGPVKALHFVSSLAVCYVPDGPRTVDEGSDMAPHLDRIPLGYAQAKCVAESLLRQAAERGVPVSILRCGLICGDSVSGNSNHDDLLSRLLRGAVMSGIAADVDWGIDCVPVDTAAQAICVIAREASAGLRVLHLHHDSPRRWLEMVLWLRLNGYRVRLVPLDEWLAQVGDRRRRISDLYSLRAFFLARPAPLRGRSLTELYLEPIRRRIHSAASRAFFEARHLVIPPLDRSLLHRYLVRYREQGFLPGRPVESTASVEQLRVAVERGLGGVDQAVASELTEFTAVPLSGGAAMSELSAVANGGRTGVWWCRFGHRGMHAGLLAPVDAVLKLRATDSEQDSATLAIADLCSPQLAATFHPFLHLMAYRGGRAREIAISTNGDPRLIGFMPKLFAAVSSEDSTHGGFLEERLVDVDLLDSADTPERWCRAHIEAAVRGLAQIHSVWYRREAELKRQRWLAPGAERLLEARPLWRELACFSAEGFSRAVGEDIAPLLRNLVEDADRWWPECVAMPRSLIHNDFNPRNLALRRGPRGPVLCAYDWELATIGLPQYDLAELLCFVLPEIALEQDAETWIDLHRWALSEATGQAIEASSWRAGFALALRTYMVSRLPFYAMLDRFKPQPFLGTVVSNWLRLHRWAERKGATGAHRPFLLVDVGLQEAGDARPRRATSREEVTSCRAAKRS